MADEIEVVATIESEAATAAAAAAAQSTAVAAGAAVTAAVADASLTSPDAVAAKAAADATAKAAADAKATETQAAETARRGALTPEARAAEDKVVADAVALKAPAPEKYAAFVAPEGLALDATFLAKFEGVAKGLNLSQAAAQRLVHELAPAVAQRNAASVTSLAAQAGAEWLATAKADAALGGEKFEANLVVAKNGLQAVATPEFVKFLQDSHLGNHPEMIRAFYKVGKLTSADSVHVSGNDTSRTISPEDRLWPGTK